MKRSTKSCVILMVIFFSLPLINFVAASPSYVGVNEDEEYVWKINFHEDVYNDFFLDYNDTSVPIYDDDLEGIKVKVDDIKEEKSFTVYYQNISRGNFDAVEIECIYYETDDLDDEDDWDKKDESYYIGIFDYDEDLYDIILFYGALFIADNVDWSEIADVMDDDLEDDPDMDGGVTTNGEGLYVRMNPDDSKQVKLISSYTENGVLESFEFKYNDDILFSYKLDVSIISDIILWSSIIFITLLCVTISGLIIVLSLQKKKREVIIQIPFETTVPIETQEPSDTKIYKGD